MLPYYGVSDNLTYCVNGYNVELMGQVTRPTLKADAERVVKQIEGVEKVTNTIEVLPVSPNDDRIRLAVYRAIYGHTTPWQTSDAVGAAAVQVGPEALTLAALLNNARPWPRWPRRRHPAIQDRSQRRGRAG
jgi:hypothetical protein